MATSIGSSVASFGASFIPDFTDTADIQTALKLLYYGTGGTLNNSNGIYGALYTLYTGDPTLAGNVTITGNLTVNGTTTTINSTTLNVDDILLELGAVTTPSNTTANGGGISLLGGAGGNKTITWDSTNANWTSNQPWNLTTGNTFKINNTIVLSSTQVLGRTPAGTSAGDIATIDATQTLTNKTLTSPAISGATAGVQTISTTATIAATTDIAFISASAAYTITLPTPTAGRQLSIIRTDSTAFAISITGNIAGSAKTNDATYFPLSSGNRRLVLVGNGSTWYATVNGIVTQ